MIVLPLCFVFFLLVFNYTPRGPRDYIVYISILIYSSIVIINQLYLENQLIQSFNPSDPRLYYELVSKLNVDDVLELIKKENFYFFINWLNTLSFSEPGYVALSLKFSNIFIFMSLYLLLTCKKEKVCVLEFLLLFHPYVIFIVVRNLRDFYILFILFSVILLLISSVRKRRLLVLYSLLLYIMYLFRPFFCLLLLMLGFYRCYIDTLNKRLYELLFICISFLVIFIFKDEITRIFASSFLSVLNHSGESNDSATELLSSGMEGVALNFSFFMGYAPRWGIAVVSFVFTPHPISFLIDSIKYSENQLYSIYTMFDVVLIVAGGLINYLIVFPLLFHAVSIRTQINGYYKIAFIYIVFMYSVFLLGVADIRIRYLIVIIVLAGLMYKKDDEFSFSQVKPISYMLSFCVFLGLYFLKGNL